MLPFLIKNDNLEVRKENLFIQQILMKIMKKSHSYLEQSNENTLRYVSVKISPLKIRAAILLDTLFKLNLHLKDASVAFFDYDLS